MGAPVHIAITRRVRKEYVGEFGAALSAFAARSLLEPGTCGVHCLHPPAGSDSREFGILRGFSSPEAREAFYASNLYREWEKQIAHMTEGEPEHRELKGLEAWFRDPHTGPPPRWKMALLTWAAVWPVSLFVSAMLKPLLGTRIPHVFHAGLMAGGIVIILTWVAMPSLVRAAKPWLHPDA